MYKIYQDQSERGINFLGFQDLKTRLEPEKDEIQQKKLAKETLNIQDWLDKMVEINGGWLI